MFSITALPASFGDCLWIEYGSVDAPFVILIDAGPSAPRMLKLRLQDLAKRGGSLELVVVTHVDSDHIGGMLNLLENDFYGVPVRDLWFNGFRHLPLPELLEAFGERQGERLTKLLLEKKIAWNVATGNEPVMVHPTHCPVFHLTGGPKVTLLSPDIVQLKRLRVSWVKVCGEADLYADLPAQTVYFGKDGLEAFGGDAALDICALAAQPFVEDSAEANGSSIAFLLEYENRRILLGADAYPSRLTQSLRQLEGEPPFSLDLMKVPHHGSENNLSQEFVGVFNCSKYLFSSNGSSYGHPARASVARVIQHGNNPTLYFNYKSPSSEVWDNPILKSMYTYSTDYGSEEGITIDLQP
ncbi:ComEC/Rec2 family competence protein [Pseudomonas viridiflava]|uniref:ComEC/Rec2 family competence protein n=1 Tax=Pseudomonas viridiflava TaxID=33069 RepID=UPI002A69EEE0|nr:MBL fold metallo-hydrolase [Pseudomonas viridiflava]MDY0917615.1 MBL fold metallo-hydrolase [Pseudomonas viridiflava]